MGMAFWRTLHEQNIAAAEAARISGTRLPPGPLEALGDPRENPEEPRATTEQESPLEALERPLEAPVKPLISDKQAILDKVRARVESAASGPPKKPSPLTDA